MADAPIQQQYREMLNSLAEGIDDVLNGPVRPKKIGFALFMFEFGKIDANRVNYISNGDRAEMLIAVREWLARAEGRVIEPGGRQSCLTTPARMKERGASSARTGEVQ